MTPIVVGFVGIALSLVAFWFAQAADERRVRTVLDSRSDWLARDIEAKIRLSGNAVESLAIALAANPRLDAAQFARIAARARHGLLHVNSLQWAPRVARDDIAAFEQAARADGRPDYRVFDVTADFRRTALGERAEYFPVLFDTRFGDGRHVPGLALGLHEGRGLPMQKARAEGRPVATLPVRPIGAPTPRLVYLLFWPVYEDVDVPATAAARHAGLSGFALGNYDVAALLTEALRETPQLPDAIAFAIGPAAAGGPPAETVATYASAYGRVETAPAATAAVAPAQQAVRAFTVFDQRWRITFGYSETAVDALRSQNAWGWLLAGSLLTAFLAFYLVRARDRAATIAALVEERTAELQRTSAQLQQAQKMEAIGNLTGGMAHDFNNLLSVTIGNLDILQDRLRHDPESLAFAEQALQASLRGADLTRQLLAFARRQPLQPSVVNVNELVAGMTRLLKRILEEDIEVALIAAPAVWPVLIDPSQLNAAIANLATNARDAMPSGGRLTVETRNVQLDADYAAANPEVVPGDFVLIEVSDTGTGMSAEALSRAFEPFFTTKEAGRGTGLGLSMVFGFVKQSQGHVKIYSELGQGTTVRLYLPRAEAAGVAESPPPPLPVATPGHETILVVDDNAPVRATVARQLADLGYQVIEAENGQAALAVLADTARAIDVLFTDLVMPGGINGHDLARAAVAARPGLRVLYTSGYSSGTLRGDDRLKEDEHFLSKPYRKAELARKLREVLGR
ncbi:MAG: CHASE domain-containing protein [Rhodospirillaceae bacterium]